VGLLSIGATSPQGFENLATHWAVAEAEAERAHTTIDRRNWRLVAPMFLADTEAESRQALRFGYEQVSDYLAHILPVPTGPRLSLDERIDAANASGSAVIGTADRAIAQIQRLIDASGGFGTVLLNGGYWGDVEQTMHSYEIFAKQVIPHFNGQASTGVASYDWVLDPGESWNETTRVATVQSMKEYQATNPDYHPNLPGTSEKL
jgi:limonene 1,2-monooxygenase